MADLLQTANGAERAANALLHTNGGGNVLLRISVPATPNDDAEQLGLAAPQFQDVPLTPAVWRQRTHGTEVLLSATAVRAVVGTLNAASAEALFLAAAGVVVDGTLHGVASFAASEAKGEPFCYRLTLRNPQQ